jgi:demethylmenaquinone methyltransferase/2-methoxy-6-polyprenyl-1,4-benzoquinol methylase
MIEKNDLDHSMHRYYQNRAEEYDDWYDRRGRYNDPPTNAAWHAQVAELSRDAARFGGMLAHIPNARVLDLACGTGKWSPFFAHGLAEDGRLVAYDYSPAMLEQTRLRLEEDDEVNLAKTFFVRGDAYALPFPDSTFDLVFFGFWFSHVPHDRVPLFLNEVKRVLKAGGNLLLFDSAFRPGRPAEEIAQRPLNDGLTYEVLKISYTPQQLESILSRFFPSVSAGQTREFFLIAQAGL